MNLYKHVMIMMVATLLMCMGYVLTDNRTFLYLAFASCGIEFIMFIVGIRLTIRSTN